MYLQRDIEQTISRLVGQYKVILLTGARQVGKTTLAKQVFSDSHRYVTLDDNQALSLALDDPALFFASYVPPIVVDEVQYAQSLFRQIKVLADNTDQRGQVILTGSQTYHLMQDVTESLAGRIAILEMSGLSLREMKGAGYRDPFLPTDGLIGKVSKIKTTSELWQVIHRGSMPELQNPEMDRGFFYRNYVRTYIERDVRSLIALKDENRFYMFLVSLAARTGQLFNASSVANDIGVTLKTVQHWSSILEASGILRFVQPYYDNICKRLIKTPKVYFMDTGLVCHLLGWTTPEVLERGAMAGPIFETFVVSEVLKSYLNAGGDERSLFFYRDIQKREIDLLIKTDNTLFPIEIKKAATPGKEMISSFSALDSLNMQVGMGALICLAKESTYLTKNVITVPVDII